MNKEESCSRRRVQLAEGSRKEKRKGVSDDCQLVAVLRPNEVSHPPSWSTRCDASWRLQKLNSLGLTVY